MGKGLKQTFLQERAATANKREKMLNVMNHQGNANQNHNVLLLLTQQDDYYLKKKKEKKNSKLWPGYEKLEYLFIVVGILNGEDVVESILAVSQKVKHRIII